MKKTVNQRGLSRRRIRIAELVSVVICLLFVAVFGGKYVLLPIVNASYSAEKSTVTYNAIKNYVVEGDILDKNGNLIMGNASPGESAFAASPENYSYAYLLGYYSVNSGKENKYGLRGNLKNYSLFHLDQNNKGASVTLTTDNALQDYCYQLLNGEEGSITVIDNDTGAIRALASHSTIDYNVNDLQSFITSDVPGSQYRRGTYENDPPGSTFKVITTAAALKMDEDENLDDSFFDYNDTGSYTPEDSDFTIHNYEDKAYGEINLEEAFNNSVNCYFADLGVKVGQKRMTKMAEAFKVGSDIEIPFLATLHSSFDFGDGKPVTIAQTAFGQGNTQITPVHLALIAEAAANDGKMMAPYIVSDIKSGNMPLYHFFPHKISTAMDDTVDERLKAIMHSTAVGYGFDEGTYGMVYAKTGTAECANDRIHTYLIGFTNDYSFCISMNNGSLSSLLYSPAKALVSYLDRMGD